MFYKPRGNTHQLYWNTHWPWPVGSQLWDFLNSQIVSRYPFKEITSINELSRSCSLDSGYMSTEARSPSLLWRIESQTIFIHGLFSHYPFHHGNLGCISYRNLIISMWSYVLDLWRLLGRFLASGINFFFLTSRTNDISLFYPISLDMGFYLLFI